jgi:hypothetical protein
MPAAKRNAEAWLIRLQPALFVLLFVVFAGTIPGLYCRQDGKRYYRGDPRISLITMNGAVRQAAMLHGRERFNTGSDRFNGEWQFGTMTMTAIGAAQVWQEHPSLRKDAEGTLGFATGKVIARDTRDHDTQGWGVDAIDDSENVTRGHLAYFGYAGVSLGLERFISNTNAGLHDLLADALARRFRASATGMLETYPDETYPVDNVAAIAALALHARFRQGPEHTMYRDIFARFAEALTKTTAPSGLIYQAVDSHSLKSKDSARASGTALAAYMLSFVDRQVARKYYDVLCQKQMRKVFGFGAMREYGKGDDGKGDIDSGPILRGLSVAGTGFTIASARTFGDRDRFVDLYATAHFWGIPTDVEQRRNFALGGPIGDAILFALLTALPEPLALSTVASDGKLSRSYLAQPLPEATAIPATKAPEVVPSVSAVPDSVQDANRGVVRVQDASAPMEGGGHP